MGPRDRPGQFAAVRSVGLVLDEPAVRDADDDGSRGDLWSRVFGDAGRPALADGSDSGRAQRFALFAEVRARLARAAGRSGLVLVLDDVQWADEASAVLLADVVRQLRGDADPGVRDLPGLGVR